MGKIMELPPGTIVNSCTHIDSDDLSEHTVGVEPELVWLDVLGESGYRGTCSTCGTHYFSRYNPG